MTIWIVDLRVRSILFPICSMKTVLTPRNCTIFWSESLIRAASRHWSAPGALVGCTRCDASADLRVWCFSCPLCWSFLASRFTATNWSTRLVACLGAHAWPGPRHDCVLTKTKFRRFVEYLGTEKTVVLATPCRFIDAPRSGSVAQLTNIFQRGRSATNQYLCLVGLESASKQLALPGRMTRAITCF